jgi:hypothetical protein
MGGGRDKLEGVGWEEIEGVGWVVAFEPKNAYGWAGLARERERAVRAGGGGAAAAAVAAAEAWREAVRLLPQQDCWVDLSN